MKHLKFFIFLCILTFTVSCGQQKRYIQYKVKKGETMSQIAQKLNMKTEKLLRLNPDVVGEPKPNTFLVVPEQKLNNLKKPTKKEVIEEKLDTISNKVIIDKDSTVIENVFKNFEVYEIKKGDTFYNIEKRFGVNRQELLVLNPELKEGLKLGMVLKIKEIIPEIIDEDEYEDYIDFNKDVKVALLLPLKTYKYQVATLTLKQIFAKDAALLNIATDFYLGAELAVDSLRNKGVNIDLSVFDTGERGANNLGDFIYDNNLNDNDVVIGPFYSDEAQTIASSVNIPVVFPVYSKNQSSFANRNIIKTSPDKKMFRDVLTTYIKENMVDGNIVIVSDNSFENLQASNTMQASLQFSTNALINIITPQDGYIEKSRIINLLQPNTKNCVILTSNDQLLVSDAINSLISLPEEITVKVFATDKSNVFEKIDNNKLAKIGFTYVSDEFSDTSSFEAISFNGQYLKKNKALPSYYATKGFDITYDILMRLASGKKLEDTFSEGFSKRVETKFDYRNSDRVPENKGVFIIQYNQDLTLSRLK